MKVGEPIRIRRRKIRQIFNLGKLKSTPGRETDPNIRKITRKPTQTISPGWKTSPKKLYRKWRSQPSLEAQEIPPKTTTNKMTNPKNISSRNKTLVPKRSAELKRTHNPGN